MKACRDFTEEDRGYETPCHIAVGYSRPDGRVSWWDPVRGVPWPAYAVAWEEARGPIPDGLELDHLCRVPACVRLDHLELVSHATNMRRAVAKLTIEQVREIRRAGEGADRQALAKRYGVSKAAIVDVVLCRTWREVMG